MDSGVRRRGIRTVGSHSAGCFDGRICGGALCLMRAVCATHFWVERLGVAFSVSIFLELWGWVLEREGQGRSLAGIPCKFIVGLLRGQRAAGYRNAVDSVLGRADCR